MNTLGNKLKVTIFGQSHAPAIGCVVDGLPAGFAPDMERLTAFMARRAPGRNAWSTPRKESDAPEILSGLVEGRTCGAPVAAVIRNGDQHSRDYSDLRRTPRPSHADYTALIKYGDDYDIRGGGQFSGRLTAPLCFAGGLALQLLEQRNVRVAAHIDRIGGVSDSAPDFAAVSREELEKLLQKPFPVFDDGAGMRMRQAIEAARMDTDSVGGVIRCFALGVPAGMGEPMFGGVENRLAAALFGIPAVRGVSFGTGFAAASMRGSEHNDPFIMDGDRVSARTNHAGGVLGGITTGMPLVVNIGIKPTASIAKEQDTVDLEKRENARLIIHGRHDPCIVPRAVPVVEAVTALTLLDMLLEDN
ncbi:MAG: chorismate synthase [Oscillospiraceae bacterium]|jgi:chorismate synthase|nr:chorismate synthase [Oscillospiraceae bacterium]MCI8714538.1 chorismate synthase [Oscillospiraceae bacterium]